MVTDPVRYGSKKFSNEDAKGYPRKMARETVGLGMMIRSKNLEAGKAIT